MGSTGESERKRRHISSISSPAKKTPVSPFSEDKKLDAVVLQYQNQKLLQQLEAQNVEYSLLENKLDQLRAKQKNYDETLEVVDKSWQQLVGDLESLAIRTRESFNDQASMEGDPLCRLFEVEVAESCSQLVSTSQMNESKQMPRETTRSILKNMLSTITSLWHLNNVTSCVLLESIPKNESIRKLQEGARNLQAEVKTLRALLRDLHLKHRPLANELHSQQDNKAKNKSEQKFLTGELENANKELEESRHNLALLKEQKDVGQRAPYLFPSLGINHIVGEKATDKEKELQDLQSANKEFMDLSSTRFLDIKTLHEKKIETLRSLSSLQNTLSDINRISSSKAFQLLSNHLEQSKTELDHCQVSLEELQVEKDNIVWREREVSVKLDLAEIFLRASAVAQSHISELETLLKKQVEEKALLKSKLEGASREPGRNEIIADFKALVSSLPKGMDTMQSEISKYKEDSTSIHSLRAEVRYLRNALERKVNELESLSSRSSSQIHDIEKLQEMVHDLKESDQELKLFLEMYKRESTSPRDVIESRDSEYKAWAHVQSLQSSLDEHNLESRVKAANEAEAISQQKLATAEAEIADLRQKLEASGRDMVRLAEVLDSKREEGEAYLSEIESIGQAYEDVQNKNQHLLQQVIERDDYNIKLALEGVKTRQVQHALQTEIETINWEVQQSSTSLDVYSQKFAKLDDQLRIWSEHVGKLAEDGWQNSLALENTKRRLVDVQNESQKTRKKLIEMQGRINISRREISELHIELEKERFKKKRVEEELEALTRKASQLRPNPEESSAFAKLQEELGEYKGILKCGNCKDRQKEVVIAKCYHLFCNPCIRRTLESRHRKCPACAMSFGPNDVKPIYI